ncbi:MAG TPA: SDR family NAD(P)-dependent oxidoreductase [Myxococcales bacterium]|nr:SDR family NAD(P)-dependent oxidoreductase [Myxococcales bacterium]
MRVVVLGATSAIAQAAARLWAERGDEMLLVARNPARLEAVAGDLRTRGGSVSTLVQDLNRDEAALVPRLGDPEVILFAQGLLGDARRRDADPDFAELVLRTNLVSPVRLLTLLAPRLQKGACIAVLSSVAGDRGRAKVGAYGASKAGLDSFLSALRQRLSSQGIRVLALKPGFVDTPMTAGLPRTPLFSSPAQIGRGIVRAVDSGRDGVVYLPWWWRLIMLAIKALPERLFKRLEF